MNIQLSDHFSYPKLLRLTIPSIIMLVVTSIYSVVDGFFISNFAGKTPFAAVNFIMPVLMIVGAVGFMMGTGGGALIAKTMGMRDMDQANRIFSMVVYLSAILGAVLAVLGILFLEPIAEFLGAEGELLENAVRYGRIVLDPETAHGHLDFLYVKHGVQSRGIGKFIWFEIERLHPQIRIWETCTPYFEKRNLHFYVNVCRFHVVDFWNSRHIDPNSPLDWPEEEDENGDDGMFGFRKEC